MSDRQDPQRDVLKTDSAPSSISLKDTRQATDMSLFLDYPLRTNPFGRNISCEQIYKRAERIASAVHLLTGHISSNEPARDLARRESITLLQLALRLRSELRSLASETFKQTQASIRKSISLARILGISGYISGQNTQTLVSALDELGALLVSSQRSELAEDTALTRDDLTPRLSEFSRDVADFTRIPFPKKSEKRRFAVKDKLIKDISVIRAGGASARSERIMDILRSGGVLGIKDISSNLPEYSGKMIQRELVALVAIGKVRKMGAKRWSKYSLV